MARRISLLGSTGSIGEQTLEVVSEFPDRFRVVAMAAGRNVEKLAEQVVAHRPEPHLTLRRLCYTFADHGLVAGEHRFASSIGHYLNPRRPPTHYSYNSLFLANAGNKSSYDWIIIGCVAKFRAASHYTYILGGR